MDLSNPAHFAKAYAEHRRTVFLAAHRVLGDPARADDVVQDVFVRVWRRPAAFDAARGDLGTFLRLIARSRAIDVVREGQAAGRMTDRLKSVEETSAQESERTQGVVEREEGRAAVREALRDLPMAQREALVLAYWGGLSAHEISQRFDIPLGTAKSRIRLGLARLRADQRVVQAA
jgi:RNA polymerase sigma-70 factor (ECF subfamily)